MKCNGKKKVCLKSVHFGYSCLPNDEIIGEYPDGYIHMNTITTEKQFREQRRVKITVEEL